MREMKIMKRKILATVLAFGMATTSFSFLVPISAAQASHIWITTSDAVTGNIGDAPDGTSPNDGLARHYIQTRPGEVALGPIPPFPPTSHDRIGPMGNSGMSNTAVVDSEGFATTSVNGDPTIFIAERDKTAPLTAIFPVSVQISSMAGGNIPNGYVASAPVASFLWIEPLGFGTFGACTLAKIPSPTFTGTSVDWVAMAGVPNIFGYGVLEGTTSSGPWTEVGQSTGTSLVYTTIYGYWYSLVIYWAGTGAGFSNMQAVRGAVFGAPSQAWPPPPGPIASNLAASPNPHNGNVITEYVTVTATITDQLGLNIIGAECRIGSISFGMTAQDGAFDETVEVVTFTYNFPNGYTEGAHVYEVRGHDMVYWGDWASSAFTVTDTTAPIAMWNPVPGPTDYVTSNLVFTAYYQDFTAYQTNVANSYFRYRVNAGTWTNLTWNNVSFIWGSYMNVLGYTIPAGTFVVGDVIEYGGQVRDTAATPNTMVLGSGFITIEELPPIPTFNIPVVSGWNLISFPVFNPIVHPILVLNDAGGDTTWSVVKWYNPQTPNDPWKTYRISGTANDLPGIYNTFGLWLYIIDPGTDGMLCVYGSEPGTTQIELHAGWNLVGYPTLTNETVANAFWGTGADRVEVFDSAEPGLIKEVGPTYLMTPGKGYWVHVPVDAVWTINW